MANYMRKLGLEGHLVISPLTRKQNKTIHMRNISISEAPEGNRKKYASLKP